MAGKNRVPEFRHPETVAHLQSLTDREASKHPPIVRESGGVVTRYWREGGEVRCCEVAADGASGGPSPEMASLLAAAEAEFGGLLPRLKAALRGGGVPDLDAIETSVREGLFGCGTKAFASLLEALDAELATPPCETCGKRMERRRGVAKTFDSRLGSVKVLRSYCTCRTCGGGHFPLDRALGLEGKSATPGAECICADAASSDGFEEASRKLRNLAGVKVSKSTLRRRILAIGQEQLYLAAVNIQVRRVPARSIGFAAGAGQAFVQCAGCMECVVNRRAKVTPPR